MSGVFVKIKFVEVIKERVGLYEYEQSGHVMENDYMNRDIPLESQWAYGVGRVGMCDFLFVGSAAPVQLSASVSVVNTTTVSQLRNM